MQSSKNLMTNIATVLVFAALTNACITLKSTGIPDSGERLDVLVQDKLGSYVSEEKIGEVEHRDADNNYIGSSNVIAERKHYYSYKEWQLKQGEAFLDEEDFFRIAGDQKSYEEVKSHRQLGAALFYGGIGTAVVFIPIGLATVYGGYLWEGGNALLVSAGGIAALIGAAGVYASYWGVGVANDERVISLERASQAAASYNKSIVGK